MPSGDSVMAEERRIIPFRPATTSDAALTSSAPSQSAPVSLDSPETPTPETPVEAGRHYLKFMLPSIPIVAFILSFVYCGLLVGGSQTPQTSTGPHTGTPLADPTLPFVGALLLGLTTGALCMLIYFGYKRVTRSAEAGG